MRSLLRLLLLCAISFLSRPALALSEKKPLVVRHSSPESTHDKRWLYDRAIIELCLTKTVAEFGPFKLVLAPLMNQARALSNLKENTLIDVVAVTSTSKREQDLLVVPYSIHRDLMGIKLLLIRKERQSEFSKINSLEDLKPLTGGQQLDWADTEIMQSNGLKIDVGTNYEGLFKMLEKGRFDYFPRSLPEVFEEIDSRALDGIVVEQTLALVYSMPAYLFVNKNNKMLARRLSRGMEIAMADGSFEKLFLAKHSESINRAELGKRRMFYLTNPLKSRYVAP